MTLKTLLASLTLMTGLATSAAAQSLADEFFAQCTGPSLERQAKAFYQLQSCQQTQSCSPYLFESQRGEVITSCFETALNICVSSQEANGCTDRVTKSLSGLEAALRKDITQERIDAAIAKPGFAAKALARALDQEQPDIACETLPMRAQLTAFGVSDEVACAAVDAIVSYDLTEGLVARLARIETAE